MNDPIAAGGTAMIVEAGFENAIYFLEYGPAWLGRIVRTLVYLL